MGRFRMSSVLLAMLLVAAAFAAPVGASSDDEKEKDGKSPPPPSSACPLNQEYWKAHGPYPTEHNAYEWPEPIRSSGLKIGAKTYTPLELLNILKTEPKENACVIIARELIAARLNAANGVTVPYDVADAINAANAILGSGVLPGCSGCGEDAKSTAKILEKFNKGEGCKKDK